VCSSSRERSGSGTACTCDCACQTVDAAGKTWIRDCTSQTTPGTCSTAKNNALLAGEPETAAEPAAEPEPQENAVVQPPQAPVQQPQPTPRPPHHKRKDKKREESSSSSSSSSSDSDSDDDDDEESVHHHKKGHEHCGNGRREHGELCDSSADDGWFSFCNTSCEFEPLWNAIFLGLVAFAIFVCCFCFFCVRCVHSGVVRSISYSKVRVCKLHNKPGCEICTATQTKAMGITIVKNAPASTKMSGSSSSLSSSESKKSKTK
jgi:hypothetical protein